MGNFYIDVIQQDPRYLSPDRIADLALLEPVTRQAVQNIIASAAALGITLEPFETYRSQSRQEQLFTQGATKLRTVGVHGYGLACDLVKVIDGEPSWQGDFTFLVPLCAANGMISGCDWGQPGVKHTFVDADHVQRVTVADQDKLFAGSWYPDDAYSPHP